MILLRPRPRRSDWHWRHAYLPTRMDDGTWIWIEDYRARHVDVGRMGFEWRWQRHLTEEEDW